MNMRLSQDARPQATLLVTAAVLSIILWFIPFAELLTYPFRLFVTFIHEGGHAIAALLTGNSVQSLSIATNASGETYTSQGGTISQIFVASAGYITSMIYGATLLVLIRRSVAARAVLIGSAVVILSLTLIYGLFKPIASGISLSGIPFTLLSGVGLSAGLILLARLANSRIATFFVSFLAVQCILNALLDLKTVFFLSAPFAPSVPTDAMNMANATGIPAIFWATTWIVISIGILFMAMRLYITTRNRSLNADMTFGDLTAGEFARPVLPEPVKTSDVSF